MAMLQAHRGCEPAGAIQRTPPCRLERAGAVFPTKVNCSTGPLTARPVRRCLSFRRIDGHLKPTKPKALTILQQMALVWTTRM